MEFLKILVVEDYEPFRRFICSSLRQRTKSQIIDEAADGLEAVHKTEEFHPDLILLDIGLPKLNGFAAARRIRKFSPNSKILFLSQESSPGVVQEAFDLGARGFLSKCDAGNEFLRAVDTVLRGEKFVSSSLGPHVIRNPDDGPAAHRFTERSPAASQEAESDHNHQVASYRDDASFVADFSRFIEAALNAGNPAIVVATDIHRSSLICELQARGWDIAAAVQEGLYISLDASDALSTFMVNDWPDSVQVWKTMGDIVGRAAQAAKCENPRVAACGEMAPTLLAQGKGEAAVRLERLTHVIAKSRNVDILCGYMLSDLQSPENGRMFKRISAEHTAVYCR